MTSSIDEISTDGWHNIIDTGEVYTEQAIDEARTIDSRDDVARIAAPVLAIIGVGSGIVFLATILSNNHSFSDGVPYLCIAGAAFYGHRTADSYIDSSGIQKLKDVRRFERSQLSSAELKTETSASARLEAIGKTFEKMASQERIDKKKIYSVFFKTLAHHENLQYVRPKDLYDIKSHRKQVSVVPKPIPVIKNGQFLDLDEMAIEQFRTEFSAELQKLYTVEEPAVPITVEEPVQQDTEFTDKELPKDSLAPSYPKHEDPFSQVIMGG
ncbi:MAG: hypothetical protein JSR58_07330 [Verrucomicrobia bacterium]|nr:hypothetical protein [Verrucomicrobiota bacterium]